MNLVTNYFRYIKLVKKHGLEISQPGLEANKHLTWQMTKRKSNKEVHKWALHQQIHSHSCCKIFYNILISWLATSNKILHEWSIDSHLSGKARRNLEGVLTLIFRHALRMDPRLFHGLQHSQRHATYRLITSCLVRACVRRFIEIMAPVFSRDAWRCTWHLIQVYVPAFLLLMLPPTTILVP